MCNVCFVIVYFRFVYPADITKDGGTQAQPLEMSNETSQVDATALQIALKFIYLGFIEEQKQVCSEHLMSLVALAEFQGIASLALACKTLIGDYVNALTPDSATEVLQILAFLSIAHASPRITVSATINIKLMLVYISKFCTICRSNSIFCCNGTQH